MRVVKTHEKKRIIQMSMLACGFYGSCHLDHRHRLDGLSNGHERVDERRSLQGSQGIKSLKPDADLFGVPRCNLRSWQLGVTDHVYSPRSRQHESKYRHI